MRIQQRTKGKYKYLNINIPQRYSTLLCLRPKDEISFRLNEEDATLILSCPKRQEAAMTKIQTEIVGSWEDQIEEYERRIAQLKRHIEYKKELQAKQKEEEDSPSRKAMIHYE